MPNNRKKAPVRSAKVYWLPMPRRQAEVMVLQYRMAAESLRRGRAGQMEAQCIAQAVVLANMLTQVGYGKLAPSFISDVEENVLAMLERGGDTGDWTYPEAGMACLIDVINEHDRQLREVHLAALIACNERLAGFIETITRAPARHAG